MEKRINSIRYAKNDSRYEYDNPRKNKYLNRESNIQIKKDKDYHSENINYFKKQQKKIFVTFLYFIASWFLIINVLFYTFYLYTNYKSIKNEQLLKVVNEPKTILVK